MQEKIAVRHAPIFEFETHIPVKPFTQAANFAEIERANVPRWSRFGYWSGNHSIGRVMEMG